MKRWASARRVGVAPICFWLSTILLTSASPAGLQFPTFRGSTDNVLVDVVVTDRNDKPIADLRQEDFEIFDRGRAQRSTSFRYVSVPPTARQNGVSGPSYPSVDVATNASAAPNARAFVVIIDDLHLIETDIVATRLVLNSFLDAVSSDDHVAVVFVGRSDLGQDFTADKGRLRRAIDRVREAFGFGLDASTLHGNALNHARSAAQTITNVAASLAQAGFSRRAVLYESSQSVIDPHASMGSPGYRVGLAYQGVLDSLFDAARRANVPIYAIDPRGLATPETAVRGWGATTADARAGIAARIRVQQINMETIAENTGGRAFVNRSDLAGAVQEFVQENSSYYLLSFSPDPLVRDGKFHEIEVRVTRPGVRVRARPGYVVAAPAASAASPEQLLATALAASAGSSGLGIRAVATPVSTSGNRMTVAVTVDVMYPRGSDDARQLEDTLTVGLVALDGDGQVQASSRRRQSFRAAPKGPGDVAFLVNEVIGVPSRSLVLRIAVASQALREVGSASIPIELSRSASGDLELGGVALGLGAARTAPTLGGALLSGIVPFQPTTIRTFTSADTVRVFVPVFWRSRDQVADVTLSVDSEPAVSLQRQQFSIQRDDQRRGATVDAALNLTGLPPGAYVLAITARLASGSVALRHVAFAVSSLAAGGR